MARAPRADERSCSIAQGPQVMGSRLQELRCGRQVEPSQGLQRGSKRRRRTPNLRVEISLEGNGTLGGDVRGMPQREAHGCSRPRGKQIQNRVVVSQIDSGPLHEALAELKTCGPRRMDANRRPLRFGQRMRRAETSTLECKRELEWSPVVADIRLCRRKADRPALPRAREPSKDVPRQVTLVLHARSAHRSRSVSSPHPPRVRGAERMTPDASRSSRPRSRARAGVASLAAMPASRITGRTAESELVEPVERRFDLRRTRAARPSRSFPVQA